MPPLPRPTPATSWFWTSGADGRPRIQRCDAVVTTGGGTRSGVLVVQRDGAA